MFIYVQWNTQGFDHLVGHTVGKTMGKIAAFVNLRNDLWVWETKQDLAELWEEAWSQPFPYAPWPLPRHLFGLQWFWSTKDVCFKSSDSSKVKTSPYVVLPFFVLKGGTEFHT
jgi:hypothetical protein